MNCPEAEQFFDAYLDGELSGSLRLEFDAHRLRCAVCQQKLAMMEACEHILARDSRMAALSDDFADRVMSEIEERRVIVQRTRKRRLVFAATVAMQAAAVFVFAVLWSGYWKPTAGPALDTVTFTEKVGVAMKEKDPVRLNELIWARADQLIAARSNLTNEVSALAAYAPNVSFLSDLSSLVDATPSSWFPLMPIPAPVAAEETEPASSATGPFSL